MHLETRGKAGYDAALFEMIRRETQEAGLKNTHPKNGKYKVRAVIFNFLEPKENVLNPVAGTCTAHVVIQNKKGKIWTWNRTVEDVLPDLLHSGSKIKYGEIELAYCALKNEPIPRNKALDSMNRLSPERDSLAYSRIEFLDAIGAHHLVELEPNKKYLLSSMELTEVNNPTLNKSRILLHVRLIPVERRRSEVEDAELFLYFDEHQMVKPLIKRTYKLFESRMGKEIVPRAPFPTVIGVEGTEIFEHLFCEEPKFKKGELYVLDRVMKKDGNFLVVEAHNLKDHELFETWHDDLEAALKGRKETKADYAAEEKATIRLSVQTYVDEATSSVAHRRKQSQVYAFLNKLEWNRYSRHSNVIVFSPIANIYDNTLDFAEAPGPKDSGLGLYVSGAISLDDKDALEKVRVDARNMVAMNLVN